MNPTESWKEKFDTLYGRQLHDVWGVSNTEIGAIEHFISTEIIEKLIADIPDEIFTTLAKEHKGFHDWVNTTTLKQSLRDKWL